MSDDTQKSHEEKVVDDHRQMLLLSGNLSEFQLKNLKQWGFVLFGSDLKQAQIDYNFVREEDEKDLELEGRDIYAGTITYDFVFNKKIDSDYMKKCIIALEIWVKFMFWSDTELVVKIEGKPWEA